MIDVSSRLPHLNTFCFCASLRTGCLTLGWLVCAREVFKYLLLLIEVIQTTFGGKMDLSSEFLIAEFYESTLMEPLASVAFLIGLHKNEAAYLLPALIMSAVKIVDFIILGLVLLFTRHIFYIFEYLLGPEDEFRNKLAINAVVGSIVYVAYGALFVYAFLVINSYFNVLRRGRGVNILEEEEV